MDTFFSWWQNLDRNHRIGLAAMTLLLLALPIGGYVWMSHDRYEIVADSLDERSAARLLQVLERDGIAHRFRMPGTLLVQVRDVPRARIALSGQSGFSVSEKGFELFDKTDYAMTDFAQKISYQRALQGEMARTLERLKGIRAARVHLNLPERRLFDNNDTRPSASVVLDFEDDYQPGAAQIDSIRELVAASVERLEKARVVVIDSHGMTLSGGSEEGYALPGAHASEQQRLERHLVDKIRAVVMPLAMPGIAVVNVSVALDFDQSLRRVESVVPATDNAGQGILVESRTQRQERQQPGTASASGGRESDQTVESRFEVGRAYEEVIRRGAKVERISASVLLPAGMTLSVVEELRTVIAAAIGFNASRGDVLVVYALPEALLPEETPVVTPVLPVRELPTAVTQTEVPRWLPGVALAVAALLAVILIVRAGIAHRRRRRVWQALQHWLDDAQAVSETSRA